MTANPVIVRNLNHTFGRRGAKRQVLVDISLEIGSGEIVILTGPSGSGKSTLLTLIGALRSAQEGELTVLGESLADAGEKMLTAVRRRIGFIFQHHNLLESLTIGENVEMGFELHPELNVPERRRLALESLAAVGLAEEVHKYPEHLSGGQKQRAAIARAIAVTPTMILADEPTASLDKESGRNVADLLRTLARERGTSVVLVTHDNRVLDIADRIIHLEDGKLVPLEQAVISGTRRMMSLFSRSKRHEDLTSQVLELPDPDFLSLLDSVTNEARQFLQALEMAGNDAFEAMLDQALWAFTQKIEKMLNAERVTLYIVDRAKGELWSKVARDSSDTPLEIRIPMDSGIAGHVAQTGQAVNIPDAYADPRFNRSVDQETGFRTRCMLSIPMVDQAGRVLGVAHILNRKDGQPFDDNDEARSGALIPSLQVLLESWIKMRSHAPDLGELS